MIKMLTRFLLICIFISGTVEAVIAPVPSPPKQPAKSYLLIDFNSGRVLAEKNIDKQIEPASITKLMTAYVVYKELDAGRLSMDEKVTVSEKAWRMKGSKMFIEVGKQVSVEDLLKGLVIQSGNDATVALAEHIAGSESTFADYMNQYAKALGMNDTNFVNSTGWPNRNHKTTARDIATLGKAVIKEFPERYKLYAEKQFEFNGIPQYNRNKLLWRDKSVDGMKTGHTESAGYCLISSAKRDDMRLIAVVLGTRSEKARADVSQSLLSYGFRFYESSKLYAAGEGLNQARVWKGENEQLNLGLQEDLHVTIPRGQYKHLDAVMDVNKDIVAPVEKGQQLGTVKVMLDGEEIISRPLVALQSVDEGSLWQRTKDQIIQLFR
ncbi:MAG: D-alanyl-D-alanine carboxypeptidase [Gammaproteobacteria bacterium]|nr:D-alanyl-D-alanine carboxypeptidase [Gammaproteobacteria bacterium]MCW8909352.1 D-alanyl-D-alanine carboxypeptidase [Gammaproteobacteria bacterium]MCW9006053.1 D-alanyl-D-alanine carboxypeptidase [Gammaproteobacteria bacterium]MCW9056275.1 D-alanyl-D-alanine carboxypeptidase [Gammaproteobacteria bacterium]